MKNKRAAAIVLGFALAASADLSFTVPPSLASDGQGRTWVEFTLNQAADVAVCVVRSSDSAVVRHLAAGMLGGNAPAPLVRDSLHQRIEWDGNDDFGRPADVSGGAAAWVRAGMSPVLDRMVERDNHGRSAAYTWTGSVQGLMVDSTGTLYAMGKTVSACPWYSGVLTLRAYDGESGAYRRTVLPMRAGLSQADAVPYEVLLTDRGGYHPKTIFLPFPDYQVGSFEKRNGERANTQVPVWVQGFCGGDFTVVNYPNMFEAGCVYGGISSAGLWVPPARAAFVRSPAMPAYADLGGPLVLAPFPGQGYVLMTGLYRLGSDTLPVDTGFWQDGRVYKVDRATGVATALIALRSDSLPATGAGRRALVGPGIGGMNLFSAIQGLCTDASGHIFICDRMHGQIGIYDTAGTFIRAVPVVKPDQVCVNGATGEFFVLSRECTRVTGCCGVPIHDVTLRKFSDWRANPAEEAVLSLTAESYSYKIHMALNPGAAKPVVWLALPGSNVTGIRDDGAALTRFNDFADSADYNLFNFDRIAVDRKSETVYIQNSWWRVHKVEDWTRPVLVSCSTTAGGNLVAGDICVSKDGFLYARLSNGSAMNGGWDGPIQRFTLDHIHAPAPFAGRGTNEIVPQSQYHSIYGAGFADRSFDISKDGKMAYMHFWGGGGLGVQVVDTAGARLDDSVITSMPTGGGVKIDYQGNLYVGALMRPSGHATTPGFEADTAYLMGVGSVVKFAPGTRGTIGSPGCCGPVQPLAAVNALRVYAKAGLATFSGHYPYYGCSCRSPRFDVDPFGRLFLPNAVTGQVAVLDNEDNLIARFGEYGNWDSKGPGSLVPTTDVPLSWPAGAAASESHIYVTDMVNERLVRVRMNYALDNLPWVPDAEAAARADPDSPLQLAVAPNPFNPSVTITLAGRSGGGTSLKVFDLTGRLMADLSENVKAGTAVWNAAGRASGVYVVVAGKNGLMLKKKVILAK